MTMPKSKVAANKFVAQCYRESYYAFLKGFWSTVVAEKFIDAWYIRKLCDELQSVSERVFEDLPKTHDLIWNCPPNSSKSSCVSIFWQPWIWTRMASARFISGSYSERLALDLSRKSRDVVKSDYYHTLFPEIELRHDQDTKGYFANTKGGFRYAVGVGSSVVGFHGHFLVIDDPIDPLGALSDLVLDEANSWMKETLSRRKVHQLITVTALIMQRLHQDDPTGNMIDRGTSVKQFIVPGDDAWPIQPESFKSYYTENDGLMDPIRWPREALESAYKDLGEAGYAGQVGQCLTADTQIQTSDGLVAIHKVRPGQKALTRTGWRRVLWSGLTKRIMNPVSVLFENGAVLSGTADHPVWTRDNEFVGLAKLSGSCYNLVAHHSGTGTCLVADRSLQLQRLFSSMELCTPGQREQNTSALVEAESKDTFIKKSGSFTTETSPTAITSITRTKTLAIIGLRILNVSLIKSILTGTWTSYDLRRISNVLKRAVALDRMVLKATGIKSPTKYTLALSVEESSSLVIVEKSSSAQELARSLSELGKTLHASVPGVEQYSLQGMPEADAAPLGVDDDTIGIPVYDLTVEESPEFFANGVLVHNSPIPRGGAMFKTDRLHYESNPPVTWKRGPVRGWDKAGTKTKRSAYTVGVKIAEDMLGRIWILDVIRDQWNSAEREDNMVSAGKADLPKGRQVVEQEPASSGLESADRTIKRMAREGVRCIAVPASGNKELRADSFSQEVNAGNVILVNAHWNKAFVEELKFFPRSKYKDQVDAASLAHSQLTGKKLKIGALR